MRNIFLMNLLNSTKSIFVGLVIFAAVFALMLSNSQENGFVETLLNLLLTLGTIYGYIMFSISNMRSNKDRLAWYVGLPIPYIKVGIFRFVAIFLYFAFVVILNAVAAKAYSNIVSITPAELLSRCIIVIALLSVQSILMQLFPKLQRIGLIILISTIQIQAAVIAAAQYLPTALAITTLLLLVTFDMYLFTYRREIV